MISVVIRKSEYQSQPWKNGQGITEQIAISGDGSFLWRLSTARIDKNSVFSLFPGYQRILIIVEGNGIELNGEQGKQTLLPFEPFSFSGAEQISASLLNGPVRDLNLFKKDTRAAMEVIDVAKEYSLSTRWDFAYAAADFRYMEKGGEVLLNAGDSLKINGAKNALFQGKGKLILIRF